MFPSEIVNPNITFLIYRGLRTYKSPAHFMWTTKKLSVDCHHNRHIVLSCKTPLQQQIDDGYLNLNQFETRIYGAEQPPVSEATVDLMLLYLH